MPENAIAAGVVDFRGSPERIATELARLGRHPYVATEPPPADEARDSDDDEAKNLVPIFAALRRHVGVDFSSYKRTTVSRRIARRMALRRVADVQQYASVLGDDPDEVRALAQDMLIHVTSFFRDPEAFEALKSHVFKDLVQRKAADDFIRVWVPGCATGEEAYALAICLLESLDEVDKHVGIKLFGTDLSTDAIDTARLGVYSESSLAELSPERLSRFFERVDQGYRIGRLVRDMCVFVKHDLTRDPPFAKLDLISCRNVLIYFDADLQRRVVPMLHYCLNPHGYLFVGKSEAITGFADLFAPVDKDHRIFTKTGNSVGLTYPPPPGSDAELKLSDSRPPQRRHRAREAQSQADHLLLTRYAPPGVIVNDRFEVIQFRGRTGGYLEPAPGQPQANVLRMARGGLAAHLHEAVERAKSEASTVRKEGLRVKLGSEIQIVDVEVVPLAGISDESEPYFLILFEAAGARPAPERSSAGTLESDQSLQEIVAEAERVKAELVATKDYLQSIISEHQSTADDLAAVNEELVAANEELQSTNEELQSAKEELQSTNEELSTVTISCASATSSWIRSPTIWSMSFRASTSRSSSSIWTCAFGVSPPPCDASPASSRRTSVDRSMISSSRSRWMTSPAGSRRSWTALRPKSGTFRGTTTGGFACK
jgi:two-component system CheB/CheR fusion protein